MITEKKERRKKNAGFTLIELLVVITIIAILGAVVAPKLLGHSEDAKVSAALAEMKGLQLAADTYYLAHGKGISSLQDLVPESYKADKLPTTDPWGGSYTIETGSDGLIEIKCANYEAAQARKAGSGGATATIGGGK